MDSLCIYGQVSLGCFQYQLLFFWTWDSEMWQIQSLLVTYMLFSQTAVMVLALEFTDYLLELTIMESS